ncbi:MAG: hydroxymethylbilane synthase [Thaumarchaeota archaeon]|nr:hydroxymethylbilane synthase [Nitrososphaerota archaeon]
MSDVIRVGTRSSSLALEQTRLIVEKLRTVNSDLQFEVVPTKTEGDEGQRKRTSGTVSGKDIFTKTIEDKLLASEIDLAVHSLKDLPAGIHDNLLIGAVPEREDARDALVSVDAQKLSELPKAARVGTSSVRRKVQLLAHRPDLVVEEIHGNIETRIRKMRKNGFDAIVLASAGLIRLGLQHRISEYLPIEIMLPAPGQGALAIQMRKNDSRMLSVVRPIEAPLVRAAVEAERAFAEKLGGGCNLPVAAYGIVEGDVINLMGLVASTDGRHILRGKLIGEASQPQKVGYALASKLSSLQPIRMVGEAA